MKRALVSVCFFTLSITPFTAAPHKEHLAIEMKPFLTQETRSTRHTNSANYRNPVNDLRTLAACRQSDLLIQTQITTMLASCIQYLLLGAAGFALMRYSDGELCAQRLSTSCETIEQVGSLMMLFGVIGSCGIILTHIGTSYFYDTNHTPKKNLRYT